MVAREDIQMTEPSHRGTSVADVILRMAVAPLHPRIPHAAHNGTVCHRECLGLPDFRAR